MTPSRPSGSGDWFHPRGSLARGGWELVVDASLPGWQHTGLRVAELASGDGDSGALELRAGEVERQIVPLAGSFRVQVTGGPVDGVEEFELAGRASVFDGPTDTLYLPAGVAATIRGTGRVAVAEAPSTRPGRVRHLARSDAPLELRGRGRASRQVHDLGTPAVLDAERLIVCEVITPAGNWSSYPPHKHDEEIPGHESQLEEIYYFEVAPERADASWPTPPADGAGADPFGMFTAASSNVTEIAVDARVRSGDVALIPGGYHGPAAAPPGYDLYYLNVMAGPGERVWRITDEPAHAWVRDAWADEAVDPRLPYPGGSNLPDAPNEANEGTHP